MEMMENPDGKTYGFTTGIFHIPTGFVVLWSSKDEVIQRGAGGQDPFL